MGEKSRARTPSARAHKAGEFAGTVFVMLFIGLVALSIVGIWVKYFVIGWVMTGTGC